MFYNKGMSVTRPYVPYRNLPDTKPVGYTYTYGGPAGTGVNIDLEDNAEFVLPLANSEDGDPVTDAYYYITAIAVRHTGPEAGGQRLDLYADAARTILIYSADLLDAAGNPTLNFFDLNGVAVAQPTVSGSFQIYKGADFAAHPDTGITVPVVFARLSNTTQTDNFQYYVQLSAIPMTAGPNDEFPAPLV